MARRVTFGALVGALYVVLTLALSFIGFGPVQFRVAEALCLLPLYFPETIPGVAIGCLIANLFSPYGPLDIIFGTLATAAAVLLVPLMKKKWLAPLPVILINAIVVSLVLTYQQVLAPSQTFLSVFLFNALTVGLGEAVVTYALGVPLLYALPKVSYLRRHWPRLSR